MLGSDDLLLLLTHLWARDTSIFPTEDQRLSFATIMLLLIYTGCRPAELVDAQRKNANASGQVGEKATSRKQKDADDNWDSGYESMDEPGDGNPVYDRPDPWTNLHDPDYNDVHEDNAEDLVRTYKALCYEDVRLWIVKNPTSDERDLLAMEITLSHHKGADRKPKPSVSFSSLSATSLTIMNIELPSSSMKKPFQFCVQLAISWP